MFKLILLVALTFSTSNKASGEEAAPSDLSTLLKSFVDQTKFEPGFFLEAKSTSDCFEGQAEVVQTDEDVRLVIGGNPVFVGLTADGKSLKESYGSCEVTFASKHSGKNVSFEMIYNCKDEPSFTIKREVSFSKDKIAYTQTRSQANSKNETLQCSLERKSKK